MLRISTSSPKVVRQFGGNKMRKTFMSAATVLAFSVAGHADELSDVQPQANRLRDQNQALTKRVADLEKRQQKLEKRRVAQAQPAITNQSLSDAMAADLPYKTAQKA